jgi:molecular chaperone DnaK (HSP70)
MIAIDFGTTNSSVAVLSGDDKEPRVQSLEFGDPDSYDHHMLPSVVCDCRSRECERTRSTYGHSGLRHGFELSHDSSLLQEMKLHFDHSTLTPATLVETKTVTALREEGGVLNPVTRIVRTPIYEGDVPLEPAQFVPGTGQLIAEIVRRAGLQPAQLDEVVLGVPASFGGVGARRLREAAKRGLFGENSGYERLFLYPEPLAAARAYTATATGNVLVLDYGGGTLDITVMTIKDKSHFALDKIVFGGFPEGGATMDRMILDYSLSKSPPALQAWYKALPLAVKLRIKRNVEKAKIALSKDDAVSAAVEFPGSGFPAVTLTLPEISFALQPVMTRMASKVTQIVGSAVGAVENIDFVVMSGGASLSPVVKNTVIAMFRHLPVEKFVLPNVNDQASVETCMCAVAKGLALLRRDGVQAMEVDAILSSHR